MNQKTRNTLYVIFGMMMIVGTLMTHRNNLGTWDLITLILGFIVFALGLFNLMK